MDVFLFNLINHLPHFSLTDGAAIFLEWVGEKEVVYSGVVVAFILGLIQNRRNVWQGALGVFLSIAPTSFVVFFLHQIVRRPRPFQYLSDVYRTGSASSFSFPSDHAATYAAVAGFLLLFYSEYRGLLTILILVAGFARIYQGMHYPTDILAGWAIGIFFAWLVVTFFPLIEEKMRISSNSRE